MGRYGFKAALRDALPSLRQAVAGAAFWGALMGFSAFASLWLRDWETPARIGSIVLIFAAGGAIAFPIGHVLTRILGRRGPETTLAAAFLSFSVATIGATALIFALQYRHYYAQWHGGTFSIEWTFQLVFTLIGAFYQFAVLGLRLYFPWGFGAIFVLSLAYMRWLALSKAPTSDTRHPSYS